MEEKIKKGRGLGKRPALVCTSIRLPKDVMEYFKQTSADGHLVAMRQVLVNYVNQHKGESNGNSN
jgi:uncharacterized protein (DUF4415 family)